MEDKENAVDATTADRQQRGVMLKAAPAAAHGEMLPLSSETRSSLKRGAPAAGAAAAATAAAVAATPRSIGGARIPFFAATPLGQRTAGDASAVRRKTERKSEQRQLQGGRRSAAAKKKRFHSLFFSCGTCALVPSEAFFRSRSNRVARERRSQRAHST